MIINYCITVHDEEYEFKRLASSIIQNKRKEDRVFVLQDSTPTKGQAMQNIEEYCNNQDNNIQYISGKLNGDFAAFKNTFQQYVPDGEYIFQLDADEILTVKCIESIHHIINLNPTDLIWFPRINTVIGVTDGHIKRWNWTIEDDNGWINFPDYQSRLYRSLPTIKWVGKVHENIRGHQTETFIPTTMTIQEDFSIIHSKDIKKQEKQNKFYDTL